MKWAPVTVLQLKHVLCLHEHASLCALVCMHLCAFLSVSACLCVGRCPSVFVCQCVHAFSSRVNIIQNVSNLNSLVIYCGKMDCKGRMHVFQGIADDMLLRSK